MPRSSAQIASYKRLQAVTYSKRRRSKRVQYRRAQKEISRRVSRCIERMERDHKMSLQIKCRHFEPYVEQHGKQWVTAAIKDTLPVFYGVRAHSKKNEDLFEGWMITRIG